MTVATLVSVNVGQPRDISWNSRTVYTGAFKDAVTGPRMVRRLNIDGDAQGDLEGHGGENRAVLVYQLDSYRHWAREFGRTDLPPGYLGENFTVDGLPDDEVCIGDRFQIGDAVFEVTQPRVTCYRAGIRIGEPRMAALLVSHRRPGFYFRVIVEGEVEAGQEIVKVASGPEHVTVAEIDALLYLPGHPRSGLERALRIPALSNGWKASLQSLVQQAESTSTPAGNVGLTTAASSPPPAWTGFRSLQVTAVHAESRRVRSIFLADPAGLGLPKWSAGQSITVRLPAGTDDATMVRNYSLSNLPGSDEYRISVKREPDGAASGYLHDVVKPGDRIDVAAPRGTFFLVDSQDPIILLSAGVGATPVLSMLHTLASMRSDRQVWWLHGARNGDEHAFARESMELLDQLPDSRAYVYFSSPKSVEHLDVDYTAAGRLSTEVLQSLGLPPNASAYLCGPAAFMSELSAGLVTCGLSPTRIHTETFGAVAALTPGISQTVVSPHIPSTPPGPGPQVQFARSDISAPWGPPYASLLEFAEACDVPTRWSCRTGVCHNCETALLAGAVRYDPAPLEPPAPGNVLICCAEPTEAVVVDL